MLLRQFFTILKKNFILLLSTPIFLILNLTTIGFFFLLTCLPTFALDDHHLFLRDQGQATIFFIGCLTSLFCLIKIITDDFSFNTVSITLSRPVSAFLYCMANLLSLIFFLGLMQLFFQAIYLWMSEMANDPHFLNLGSFVFFISVVILGLSIPAFKQYFFGGRYTSLANFWLIGLIFAGLIIRIILAREGVFDWLALKNGIMLYLASITFICFLFPLAILYNSVSVMIVGLSLFFLGALSEYFFTQLANLASFLKSLNAFTPNWQIYWIIERLNEDYEVPIQYYINCFAHTFFIFAITLTISTLIVKKIELTR